MRRTIVIATVLVLVTMTLSSVGLRPAGAAPQGSPWGANYFPNVPLTTQDGQTVQFYDDLIKDKAVLVNLIYTSCKDNCPLETARLAQVQRLLGDRVGKDIFFYSITIDPKRDTPTVLKAYAEKFHVGPGWLFLTGKRKDIDLISKKLGLSSLTDADNPDGHQASLMLGNEATGQWMRHGAVDNPKFLAVAIGNFLDSGKPRGATRSYAEAAPLPMPAQGAHLFAGQHLFESRCAACHTLGHGDAIGPDLLGVTARRDRAWLTRIIATPDQVLKEKDPIVTALFAQYKEVWMPNLRLGPEDVEALLAYLEAQGPARRDGDHGTVIAQAPGDTSPTRQAHHHAPAGDGK
jgi:protein SCO1